MFAFVLSFALPLLRAAQFVCGMFELPLLQMYVLLAIVVVGGAGLVSVLCHALVCCRG